MDRRDLAWQVGEGKVLEQFWQEICIAAGCD